MYSYCPMGRTPLYRAFFCHPVKLCAAVFKQALRQYLAKTVPQQELSSWFDPLKIIVDSVETTIKVSFPHPFFGTWFLGAKKGDFERCAKEFSGGMHIAYEGLFPAAYKNFASESPAPAAPSVSAGSERDENEKEETEKPASAAASPTLFEHFVFDEFITNRKNDFPVAAAKASAAQPYRPPYPLFVLYGQSGSGKSHLLGAMADELKKASVPFIYGQTHLPALLRSGAGLYHAPFEEQCILLDNAQQVSAGQDMQENLSALIDIVLAKGKMLALAFDVHPASCPGLQSKLRSRLAGGLVVELKRPDLDIRRQYVQKKNAQMNVQMTSSEVLSLAQRYQDIRSIDGALTRLFAYRALLKKEDEETRIPDIASILSRGADHAPLTPSLIVDIVSRYFSVSPEEVIGKVRDGKTGLARHIAILLCRELLGLSLVQTGIFFGGRNHSSVLYSIKKVKQLQKSNKDTNNQIEELRKLCINRQQ